MRELKSPVCGRQGKIGDRVGSSHRGLGMDGRLVIRLAIRLGWSLRVADLGEFRVDEWGVLSARRCVCPRRRRRCSLLSSAVHCSCEAGGCFEGSADGGG